MTDLNEKAVAAATAAYNAHPLCVTASYEAPIAAAIRAYLAALPEAGAVKVKALEWLPSAGGKWLRAKGIAATYEIRNDDRVEEMKARCQAKHDALIRSALVAAPVQAEDSTYDDGYADGMFDASGHAVEVTQAVARWLDNHLGVGNWYDQAEEGFSADDVVQALFESVRDPAQTPPIHPDIAAAHAQFGGDLEDMQRRYDAPVQKVDAVPVAWRYRSISPHTGKPTPWLLTQVQFDDEAGMEVEPLYAAPPSRNDVIEDCAKVAEGFSPDQLWPSLGKQFAARIRAMKEGRQS